MNLLEEVQKLSEYRLEQYQRLENKYELLLTRYQQLEKYLKTKTMVMVGEGGIIIILLLVILL